MAFSNVRQILTNKGAGAENLRTERTGFHGAFFEDVEIYIVDKDSGDTSGTVQTSLRIEDGYVLLLSDGTQITAATVTPSGNGTVASLASLGSGTAFILVVLGKRIP